MKTKFAYLLIAVSAFVLMGCGGADSLDQPAKEEVTGGEVVVDFSAETMRNILVSEKAIPADYNNSVFGYKAYKIPYETTDEEGNRIKVSGLMVVPTGVPAIMKQIGFSLVSDSHGTIFANAEAPTVIAETTNSPDGAPVILTALSGFVTLQADYIGFGDSVGHYHPYLLKSSSAATTVDFINAARAFAENNGIPLNGQLFVTGYSEGGHVAMAALQALENEGAPVAFAAPMAGPYMLDRMGQGVLAANTLPVPSFIADVAYAFAVRYGVNVNTLVKEPYASALPGLFDGSKARPEIDAQLTHVTTDLFTADAINRLTSLDNTYWFTQTLQLNSTAYWGPQTPTRLVQCMGDDVIPFAMSTGTASVMRDNFGAADIGVIPVEVAITGDANTSLRLGHADCATPAYGVVSKIFADVRKATIGY